MPREGDYLREQFERLKEFVKKNQPIALVQRFLAWEPDTIDHSSEDYKKAEDAWRQYHVQDGVDYTDALAYAKEAFAKCEAVDQSNDNKAHSIIQYLSGGTAIIALGAPFAARFDTTGGFIVSISVLVGLVPPLIFAALAVWNAISVRQPQASRTLPPVMFAYEMADCHMEPAKINPLLWLVLHPIVEAAILRNARKAKMLDAAHKYYKLTIGCLVIPFAFLVISLPFAWYSTQTASSAHQATAK